MSPTGKSPDPGLSESIERYLQAAQSRGLTHKTLVGYHTSLRRALIPWAEQEGVETLRQLDQDAAERFAIYLQQRQPPLSQASQRTYLKPVRLLLEWGREHGLAGDANPPLPRQERRRRDVLTREEIDELEAAATRERDKLLVRIMGDLGVREGELANLRTIDLIRRGQYSFLRLRGKTGTREAPLAPDVASRLRTYIEHTRTATTDTDALFLAHYRRPDGRRTGLTSDGVYQAFAEVVANASLGRRVHPHLLRHSAITHMIARGMHPAIVAEICGVSAAVIASVYSHPSRDQMAAAAMAVWAD